MNLEQKLVAAQIKELIELLPVLQTMEKQFLDDFPKLDIATDTAWLCRKAEEVLKTLRIKVEELGSRAEAHVCTALAVLEMDNWKTENCTVSPNPSAYVKYPTSPKDEGYEEFVKQLPLCAMRPHYPTVSALITDEISNGRPVPFGLPQNGIKSMEMKLRVTSKKEL